MYFSVLSRIYLEHHLSCDQSSSHLLRLQAFFDPDLDHPLKLVRLQSNASSGDHKSRAYQLTIDSADVRSPIIELNIPTMATNNAFKVTKDISARKGTRVGSTQSNVEAAAMRESHEYFVSRLTESYSKQLETMEQEYEEQIRDLKARIASDVENAKQDTVANMKTEAGGLLRAAENILKQTQDELVQATNERDYQKAAHREPRRKRTRSRLGTVIRSSR